MQATLGFTFSQEIRESQAIMDEANGMEPGAPSLCLTRRLAGLLLAGTMLAAAPAFGQQTAVPEALPDQQAAMADPADAAGVAQADPATTASTPRVGGGADIDDAFGPAERQAERLNAREGGVDGARSNFGDPYAPTGIRIGTFLLRPSISQNLGYERNRTGDTATSRTFHQTGLRGSLISDWSRHQLSIEAEGIHQRNISGTGDTEPRVRVDADLRLDLSDDTVANLTAGYEFERESSSDPNAIGGATAQSGVHTYRAGARVTRDFGLIRGTIGAGVERQTYGSATLADGSSLRLSDRNNTEGTLTARIGYELSPALIPYLEASAGRAIYDARRDAFGYERSHTTLGGRAGVELDMGEKLRGDLGIGYKRAGFDDSRLAALDGLTLDGTLQWSLQRGTDLRLGLGTELEPSTTPGQSGYVSYAATADLTHELRENLVARLSAAYTLRDFKAAGDPNQTIYLAGAGVTWNINRWLAMTGDVSYELTRRQGTPDTGVTRAGIGLVLRR